MILAKNNTKQIIEHFSLLYREAGREVARTMQQEEARHFRGGNALALSMLADGFSPGAIAERTKLGIFANSKLSKAEGKKILRRAIDQAVEEWEAADE